MQNGALHERQGVSGIGAKATRANGVGNKMDTKGKLNSGASEAAAPVSATGASGEAAPQKRGRGRPKKAPSEKKAYVPTGKPRGRPRKAPVQ